MTSHRRAGRELRGPADQRTIRDHNLALVLQHVAAAGESSRARIAEGTGLNKTTVSSLVAELMDRRLLREDGTRHDGAAGRPAVSVRLDDTRYVGVGMEINVDYLAVAVVDLRGGVRDEQVVVDNFRHHTAEDSLARLSGLVADSLARLAADGLVAVGADLALPGLVDAERRRLLIAPNLGWRDLDAAALVEAGLAESGVAAAGLERGGWSVHVDNEANLGALGERWEGAGTDLSDVIYVSGEVGVGAGIIIGGELHRPRTGFGGEFGHMALVPDGPPCSCGSRGCVETAVGLEATLRRAGLDVDEVMSATGGATASGPASTLADLAAQGDPAVREALEEVGGHLGVALASAVNLLGPESVILGGYFAALHPWLEPAISRELSARVLGVAHRPISVRPSVLQRVAAVRGAAGQVIRGLLADPSLTPRSAA
ncbi:ROK family protein [Euzebya sp.]|uniref:ROK family protein n=1 Tax=Euzebya sp. TaxID=1971409 RepID=UPI003516C7A8